MSKKTEGVLRADSDLLNSLHQMVAKDLMKRIASGEATIQDISAAIKYLKDNNVTADIEFSNPLRELEMAVTPVGELPFIDEDEDQDESNG